MPLFLATLSSETKRPLKDQPRVAISSSLPSMKSFPLLLCTSGLETPSEKSKVWTSPFSPLCLPYPAANPQPQALGKRRVWKRTQLFVIVALNVITQPQCRQDLAKFKCGLYGLL